MKRLTHTLLALLVMPAAELAAQLDAAGLQATLDSARAALSAPGAAASVVLPDGATWSGASGAAGTGAAVTPLTAFELGSVTKTYTAAVVLRLVAAGGLSLENRLARWYPELPGASAITVEMLLNHTHGLHDPTQEEDFVPAILRDPGRRWIPEDLLQRMRPPDFEPGGGWRYSNTGYHLLGLVAERATGSPLGTLLREELLAPLGLDETWYGASDTVSGAVATAFIDVDADGVPEPVSELMPWTAFLTSAGAAGSMIATSADAARWMHALATGAVLAAPQWTRMTDWVERPDGNRYGLGLLRLERPEGVLLGHKGNSAGFSASVFHEPASGVTVAVLTNAHATDVTPAVLALLDAAREGLAPTLETGRGERTGGRIVLAAGGAPRVDGLRVDWSDDVLDRVNGVNLTLWAPSGPGGEVNGLAIGAVGPAATRIRGVAVGLVAGGADHLSGLGLGGLVLVGGDRLEGVQGAGVGVVGRSLRGLSVAGLAVVGASDIRGVAVSGGAVTARAVRGVSIAPYNRAGRHSGLALGLVNSADRLRGVQLGLLNRVGDNPRPFRLLPLLNLHL